MQAKQFNKIAAWRKRWISRDQVIRTNWISSVLKEILIKLGSFFQLLLRNHRAYKIIWKLSRILLSLILPRFSLMLTPSLWFLYFDQKCYKIRFRWFRWSVIFFIFFPQTCSLFLKLWMFWNAIRNSSMSSWLSLLVVHWSVSKHMFCQLFIISTGKRALGAVHKRRPKVFRIPKLISEKLLDF